MIDPAPRAPPGGIATARRLPVYAVCTIAALLVNYLLGKNIAWDTLNYHLYSGFSGVHDRFAQDYFAAGPQSYFNPYAYVPFYALATSGMPALAASSLLAAVHSVMLWLTFELAVLVSPSENPRTRLMIGISAAALAFLNPILVQETGSSFADITTAELALAGWLWLARDVREPHAGRALCAGLVLGAATALKLTTAVHALAGFAVLLVLPVDLRGKFRHGGAYTFGLVSSFLLVSAPWSLRLLHKFGNPLFPMLNGVFRSPEFTTERVLEYRFIPDSLADALWRPFTIADPVPMVHEELLAPDLRYALLVVLLLAVLARWLWRRRSTGAPAPRAATDAATRTLTAIGCGLGVDWILWLSVSGNGRYFLPMASVAGVVAVVLLFRLLAAHSRLRLYAFAAVFAAQITQLSMGSELRWTVPLPWGGPWFRIHVPPKLASEPALYLTIGTQSNSFLAPYLARGSGLINLSGGYALGSKGANGARIEALIQRYSPHVRMLIRGSRLHADAERREPRTTIIDDALERVGLQVDPADCATIAVQGLPPDIEFTIVSSPPAERPPADTTYLLSCGAVPARGERSALIARERATDLVLDRLEDACPRLFQPRRMLTEHNGSAWQRLYGNTDLLAWISGGWVKFQALVPLDQMVLLGRETDWEKRPLRLDCGRRGGRYYARVLD